MSDGLAVIGAPSAIGIVPHDGSVPRLDLAPAALREEGLATRLGALDMGDVEPPPRYADLERPAGRVRNEDDLVSYSHELGACVARCAREDRFAVVVGGDCSIVLGALLGLRDGRAAPGVLYVDAHADFATLAESPSGSACSMALALATRREERPLSRLAGDEPLASRDHVAHAGRREHAPTTYGDAALESCGVLDRPRGAIESRGAARVAQDALDHVAAAPGGVWIHFDVDVIDPQVLPATGDPAPGGIDFQQAVQLLAPLVRHPAARGLQVTLYDPTLDGDGSGARGLVRMLERALEPRRA